ncbi:MAG: hypothetical protein PHS41_11030 [Victivallaceae bacterium]|nr:hypothetical protein [Victivallaceae bacterium]
MILFITKNSPDSELVRAVVHQLLEQKILFRGWSEQTVSTCVPDDLEMYPAALLTKF